MKSEEREKQRRSIVHFFIKPRLQFRLTIFFIILSFVLSFVTLGLTFLIIRIDIDGLEGVRTAWFYLKATYPGFWIVGAVSIIVGLIVGIFASRRVALPIYKVEQWSSGLQDGDLSNQLGMRESDFWGEMAESCNTFTRGLKKNLEHLHKSIDSEDRVLRSELKKILAKYRF